MEIMVLFTVQGIYTTDHEEWTFLRLYYDSI